MLKFEWPLIVPDNEDVKRVAEHSSTSTNMWWMSPRKRACRDGLTAAARRRHRASGLPRPRPEHGPQGGRDAELIPDTPVDVIERCSGHGGTFGVVKPTHDVAVKVGRPVFRAANTQARGHIVSDCPLAAQHIVAHTETPAREPEHPIQIMARAYGLMED